MRRLAFAAALDLWPGTAHGEFEVEEADTEEGAVTVEPDNTINLTDVDAGDTRGIGLRVGGFFGVTGESTDFLASLNLEFEFGR